MGFNLGYQNSTTEGLIGFWDPASPRSWKGEPIDNSLRGVRNSYGNQSGLVRTRTNTQKVFIPTVNKEVKARVMNFYNDYGGGSGACCPNLFNYGTGITKNVSGSTEYTYSIIYKTTTGYTHPNYMYRYEYGSSGYLTEQGVHSNSFRTSLGDGWYHAWRTFTTQPGCTSLNTYFFHYEYATHNTVYLASAMLTLGNKVIRPEEHIFNVDSPTNRNDGFSIGSIDSIVADDGYSKNGGLWDLSNNGHHGRARNGVTYSTDGGGSLVFDGSNDGIQIDNVHRLNPRNQTMSAWVKSSNYSQSGFIFEKTTNGNVNTQWSYFFNSNDTFYYRTYGMDGSSHDLTFTSSSYFNTNQWNHVVATYDGKTKKVYVNKNLAASATYTSNLLDNNTGPAYIGIYGSFGGYPFQGNISRVMVYDRALSDNEIYAEYDNNKSRFGL